MLQLTIIVFVLLCGLPNDATSNSDHIGWNNWATVNDKWTYMERRHSDPN